MFVLVHGAWHGGWCWKKLVPLLRVDGYQVLTPTMTGLGERAHLLGPEVAGPREPVPFKSWRNLGVTPPQVRVRSAF